jgi:hypothetical protein
LLRYDTNFERRPVALDAACRSQQTAFSKALTYIVDWRCILVHEWFVKRRNGSLFLA